VAFPPGQLAPTNVLVQASDPRAAASTVADALRAVPGVSTIGTPVVSTDGSTARLMVLYADDPYGTPALQRTAQLREVASGALPDGRVLVGGESANALDNRTGDLRDFRVVAIAMGALILGVLVLLLRALLAPLVLLATTALSLLSALGATVLTWVVIGGQAGTNNRVLLYSLIFLVALGVDYNIFLMARVREEAQSASTRQAMLTGLAVTGGVITSAGLVLAGTFSVLAVLPLVALTQIGVTVAFGVLLDTFVVRSILVPALTFDLGRRIWWPSRLARGRSAARPSPSSGRPPASAA
jgi:RND superfamily putative drug exporter